MKLRDQFPTLYDYALHLNDTREALQVSVNSTINLIASYYGYVWNNISTLHDAVLFIKETEKAFPHWFIDRDVVLNRKVPKRGDIVVLHNRKDYTYKVVIADTSDEVNDIYSGFSVGHFMGDEYKVDHINYKLRSVEVEPVCFIRNCWPIVVEKQDPLSEDAIVLVHPETMNIIQEFAHLTDSTLKLHKVIISRFVPRGKLLYAEREKFEEVMRNLTAPVLSIKSMDDNEASVGEVVDLDSLFSEVEDV